MAIVGLTPIGMIFVRCAGEIGRNQREAISAADAATGAGVLSRFIADFTAPLRPTAEDRAPWKRIIAGPFRFAARFESTAAPKTCAKFASLLPCRERIIHVRWSGEACWIPLGDLDLGLSYENQTSFPAPGQIVVYPGGTSETEILVAYGGVRFASKVGQLAGNHFLTITEGADQLLPLGKMTLWQGAQDILFERI